MGRISEVRLAIIILMLSLTITSTLVLAQLSEEEARQKFIDLGCTACHISGGAAPPWEEVLNLIDSWAAEYESIDEASKFVNYFGQEGVFNNFDELMDMMASNVGVGPEEVADLKEFFINRFNAAAGVTPPTEPGPGPEPGPEPAEPEGLPLNIIIPVIVIVIVGVFIIAFFIRRM